MSHNLKGGLQGVAQVLDYKNIAFLKGKSNCSESEINAGGQNVSIKLVLNIYCFERAKSDLFWPKMTQSCQHKARGDAVDSTSRE